MRNLRNHWSRRGAVAWLACAALLLVILVASAADQKFDLLRSGTTVYTNVTVTSKTATDVYIVHSRGMCNLKVAELPHATLVQLGYTSDPVQTEPDANASTKELGQSSSQTAAATVSHAAKWRKYLPAHVPMVRLPRAVAIAILGGFALFYLFICHCLRLICVKTGNEPGILIWFPIVQLFPMLRAASMSPLWFLAWLVPGLNLVAQILWIFKITQARGKSPWVAVLMLLPLTNLFAFFYLAFSGDNSEDDSAIATPLVLETN